MSMSSLVSPDPSIHGPHGGTDSLSVDDQAVPLALDVVLRRLLCDV